MKLALITLGDQGAQVIARLAGAWPECTLWVHESVRWIPPLPPGEGRGEGVPGRNAETPRRPDAEVSDEGIDDGRTILGPTQPAWPPGLTDPLPLAKRFSRVVDLTHEIFPQFPGLVYVAPLGVVVRSIAGCCREKTTDPAVVAVDVCARWAIALLSGHEGRSNELAFAVANLLGAEPIVTTSSEAVKNLVVGVGCRRGTPADAIVAAVGLALAAISADAGRVRVLASADLKADEPGLHEAARRLGVPLRLVPAEEIVASPRDFAHSEFVQEKVNLPAVAEPAALLAGRRTRLLLPKTVYHGVTVAIARENFLPSA
jgi:cobalt-precorrin 5A hydrolase